MNLFVTGAPAKSQMVRPPNSLGVVAWELLHGRGYSGRARTRSVAWAPADELVRDAIARRIDVPELARRAKTLAGDGAVHVDAGLVQATVRALFPEEWRAEEALRDEP